MTIETPAARIHAYLAGLSNAQTSAIDEGRYPHAHNLTGNAVKKLLLVLLAIWLGFAAAGSVIGTVKFGGGVGSLVAVTPPIPTSLGRARLLAVILHRPERSVGIDFHVLHVRGNSLRADSLGHRPEGRVRKRTACQRPAQADSTRLRYIGGARPA